MQDNAWVQGSRWMRLTIKEISELDWELKFAQQENHDSQ